MDAAEERLADPLHCKEASAARGAAVGPRRRRAFRTATILALTVGLEGCSRGSERPSVVLFVMDTTRADAVSAYGEVQGTTPHFDRLAASGIRYVRAYAHAPWTLPSHASLFTGLLPQEHGVGWSRTHASEDLVMLAERLRDAGYDTFGVSENVWISPTFHMTQGFATFVAGLDISVEREIERWLHGRRGDRPFFLFVNVLDAHAPYRVHGEDRWLPQGVSAARARWVPQGPEEYLCARTPRDDWLAILKGLYLGDVHAADEKLGRVSALLEAGTRARIVTIVTADHGELFGERGLVSHQFSLHEKLLRVPLVVHGLSAGTGVVIDGPVQQIDVVPSVLSWLGLPVPAELPGHSLPLDPGVATATREVFAAYSDPASRRSDGESPLARRMREQTLAMRQRCDPDGPLFGDLRSVLRPPLKLIWGSRRPPRLYDLAQDPGVTRDVAPLRPEATTALLSAIDLRNDSARVSRSPGPESVELPVADDVLRQLEALGYVDDPDGPNRR